MSITIPVGKSDFDFTVSPVAELVAALHVYSEPDHHPERRAWAERVRDILSPELSEQIAASDYLWRVSRPNIFLPASGGSSLADELDAIDRLSNEDWAKSVLITSSCGTLRMRADLGSPLVNDRARSEARERAGARGPRALGFVESVITDPEGARRRVREVVAGFDEEVFAREWSGLGPALSAEARGRRDVLGVVGAAPTLAGMSTALSLVGDSVVVDKLQDARAGDSSGLTFLPTVMGDPHILVAYAPGRRPVVQYPVHREVGSPAASLERVQNVLAALDHPLRLRLLRSLVRGTRTTAELAQSWDVSAPEVSRHLALLRDAGLVTSRRDGRFVRYHADAVVLQRLGSDLLSGLLR